MIDSIHTARWLEQFVKQDIDFTLLPSKKFRKVHPRILALIKDSQNATFLCIGKLPFGLTGYVDYARYCGPFANMSARKRKLQKLLKKSRFDYVHALEIQGAGYLLLDLDTSCSNKTILSNWGSDIYYYKNFDDHLQKIKKLLSQIYAYSAECIRDYNLATQLGFKGIFLPCIPNAGGHVIPDALKSPLARNQIIVKGYGGELGRADCVVSVTATILEQYPWANFLFYSVTPDIYRLLSDLKLDYGDRIQIHRIEKKLSHDEIQREFQRSRIYIGCSISDGVSTSFLESLANGAYPIQSNTSCASEWVTKGARASIIPIDSQKLLSEVIRVIENITLLEEAMDSNMKIASDYLSKEFIASESYKFYQI